MKIRPPALGIGVLILWIGVLTLIVVTPNWMTITAAVICFAVGVWSVVTAIVRRRSGKRADEDTFTKV